MAQTKPDVVAAPPHSHAAALLDVRLSVRIASAFFWISLAIFLFLVAFLPKELADSRWFVYTGRATFHIAVALWVLADARAQNFEEERARSYWGLPPFFRSSLSRSIC